MMQNKLLGNLICLGKKSPLKELDHKNILFSNQIAMSGLYVFVIYLKLISS